MSFSPLAIIISLLSFAVVSNLPDVPLYIGFQIAGKKCGGLKFPVVQTGVKAVEYPFLVVFFKTPAFSNSASDKGNR